MDVQNRVTFFDGWMYKIVSLLIGSAVLDSTDSTWFKLDFGQKDFPVCCFAMRISVLSQKKPSADFEHSLQMGKQKLHIYVEMHKFCRIHFKPEIMKKKFNEQI